MSDADFSDLEEDAAANSTAAMDSRRHARAQHNALERRRRDNIKDMYGALKDAIPGMRNERASRATVLKKAIDLITGKQTDLERILAQNQQLEQENEAMERELERLQQIAARKASEAMSDDGNKRMNEGISMTEAATLGDLAQLGPQLAFPNRKRPAPVDEHSAVPTNT